MCAESIAEPRSPLFELATPAPSTDGDVLFVLVMSEAVVEVPFDTLLSCIFFTLEPGIIDKPKIENNDYYSDVWGLNKSLTKWTNLGKMYKARSGHVALPLS